MTHISYVLFQKSTKLNITSKFKEIGEDGSIFCTKDQTSEIFIVEDFDKKESNDLKKSSSEKQQNEMLLLVKLAAISCNKDLIYLFPPKAPQPQCPVSITPS